VGESSFWYRPTRVGPYQRPLNGRCCKAIKRRKSLLTTELRMFIKRNEVSRQTHWYVVYQVINARWLHTLNVLAVFPHASCSLLFPAIFFQKGIFEGYWCSYTFHHPALSSPTTSKYQLSQMNSRGGIMLLTELDITDKLPIDRRRYCQLSWHRRRSSFSCSERPPLWSRSDHVVDQYALAKFSLEFRTKF